ncbi:MAG: pyruvate:ferredoxin (flavodoxin) oxidoreductase [Lactobacillales bacterium]|jgi:pyruvate-ferredoxin/flavodoxin oxidoreductase|nr:pyruvate:ferredoxin (flavodoxin) oxidoreductase [Lactobacillales bacterium]
MRKMKTMDGNTAAAHIAYAFTEVAAIYPITPSTPMAELVDQWASQKEPLKNIFGHPVEIVEMQSEAGAAGAVHGSLNTGALTTTFTASQGLLLMIPNMYKIAGELLPTVFHVSARAISTNSLNIFGDHSDVMAARQTGFAMLAESSVQEVMDLSAVAHLAAIETRVPFMNFFDGFRTSHEIQRVEVIEYDELAPLVDQKALAEFRELALNPEHPHIGGTNENPDFYFQQRESVNKWYDTVPAAVRKYMGEINKLRGTNYDLVDYYGATDATEVIVAIGSINQTISQTVDYLNAQGRKVGVIAIHLYRPFPTDVFLEKLPKSVKSIAVLDRTKEIGGADPLVLDVKNVFYGTDIQPTVIAGRFGIGSKDTLPNHIISVFDELVKEAPKAAFTLAINDDVTGLNLPLTEALDLTNKETTVQTKFWGFGSDGTVGANKSAIKIIGDSDNEYKYVQGYFSYDSKKSGGLTVSHLRFGSEPINSPYLIEDGADFISCSTQAYVKQYDVIKGLKKGGTFLLNTTWSLDAEDVNLQLDTHFPAALKQFIANNDIQFYTLNGVKVAREAGLGNRVNTAMQTAFFHLTKIVDEPVEILKADAEKSYAKKSQAIVEANWKAIESAVDNLVKVEVPASWATATDAPAEAAAEEPSYVVNILRPLTSQKGDSVAISTIINEGMADGRMPLGTSKFEKRDVAPLVPSWDSEKCIQCNQCSFVCPHAAIRPYLATDAELAGAPDAFATQDVRNSDLKFRIQLSVKDCTGCGLCVTACPEKVGALVVKSRASQEAEVANWDFAQTLAIKDTAAIAKPDTVKGSQLVQPLLEFSGACGGCGETPYVKLITQLFGDRMMVANTTGCSSIWGAAVPSAPYTTNQNGHGPAWSNSLFEDNAEYGLGMRLASNTRRKYLKAQVEAAKGSVSAELAAAFDEWLANFNNGDTTRALSEKVKALVEAEKAGNADLEAIWTARDQFVKTSQWIIGGDGWAYDIGYGGLDHVIASGEDVNILVMDNEVYSNTGGQMSKATPTAAIAKFAAAGKRLAKKDLGAIAMSYGNVYVAQIANGANTAQTIKAFKEAEAYPGPSLIIAYTPCINHGYTGSTYTRKFDGEVKTLKAPGMMGTITEAKDAVASGYWSLYRFNPELDEPMVLDFKKPDFSQMKPLMKQQTRFTQLSRIRPDEAEALFDKTVNDAKKRFNSYAKAAGELDLIVE